MQLTGASGSAVVPVPSAPDQLAPESVVFQTRAPPDDKYAVYATFSFNGSNVIADIAPFRGRTLSHFVELSEVRALSIRSMTPCSVPASARSPFVGATAIAV